MKTNHRKRFTLFMRIITAVFLLSAPLTAAAQEAAEQSLFFGSDIHDSTDALEALVDNADGVYDIDFFGLVGDYGYGSAANKFQTTEQEYNTVKNILVNKVANTSKKFALAMGNHDVTVAGNHPDDFHAGPVAGLQNDAIFDVYVINWDDFYNDSYDATAIAPEDQTSVAGALANYVRSELSGVNKVLFVLCHYPLHSNRGDGQEEDRATALFQTIDNLAVEQNLDIVVLWGHTHHIGEDTALNYIVGPGGIVGTAVNPSINDAMVSTPDDLPGSFHPINFTYLNAGYVKTAEYGDAASYNTVVTVNESAMIVDRYKYMDNEITLTQSVEIPRGKTLPYGDVNGNESVNIADALLIAQYYSGNVPAGFRTDMADVNLDGSINSADALLISRYYVHLIDTLPFDTTPDAQD